MKFITLKNCFSYENWTNQFTIGNHYKIRIVKYYLFNQFLIRVKKYYYKIK